jgi:endonuclease/exonuclease/phosphatase family metal-dependent hydrolase/uncharacterized membrane protein YdjX (TVP38/TMEM64 family)
MAGIAGDAGRPRRLYPPVRRGRRSRPVTHSLSSVEGKGSSAAVMVHSKVMIVDDRFLRIGSANINNRSMGADTECDLAFEATTEDHREFICDLRRRLIGHFCGVDEATIADHEDDLLGFIDRHAQSGADRALLPIDCERTPAVGMTDIIQPIADPKQPLNLQHAARRMWTARTLLAAGGTVVALTGLALAWRTTSLSDYTDIGYVASFIARHSQSAWVPLLAVAFFVLGGLVVFPVTVMIAATAAALGPWMGAISATAGVLASSFVLFMIGRFLGHKRLQSLLGARALRVQNRIVGNGVIAVAMIRMVPVAPFSLVNVLAGASQLRLGDFLIGDGVGHGTRDCHHGFAGRADRGLRQKRLVVERGAARPHHPAVDCRVSRGSIRGDVEERTPHMMETIRIMTWNVHGTFNLNPDFDLEGVCSIIDKWSPDVVALQEIDSRRRKDDVFVRLANAVGEHRVEARSIVTEDGDYGQVLLSRWPFAGTPEVTDVSYPEREPRRAISAAIRFPIGEVTVVATHLGLSIHERHAQAQALASLVVAPRTVVIGDFNDWFWVKSVRRGLASRCPVRTRLRTFPSRLPMLRLDRIYATRNATIVKAWTDREARAYSDHLPVLADIAFEDVGDGQPVVVAPADGSHSATVSKAMICEPVGGHEEPGCSRQVSSQA